MGPRILQMHRNSIIDSQNCLNTVFLRSIEFLFIIKQSSHCFSDTSQCFCFNKYTFCFHSQNSLNTFPVSVAVVPEKQGFIYGVHCILYFIIFLYVIFRSIFFVHKVVTAVEPERQDFIQSLLETNKERHYSRKKKVLQEMLIQKPKYPSNKVCNYFQLHLKKYKVVFIF